MKKTYMMPSINVTTVKMETLMAAGSLLDPNSDEQTVTPSDDEFNGEFGSNNNSSFWEED